VAENWIQSMNRLTGPAPCQCSITGPHQPGNPYCSRNRASVHQSEPSTKVNGVTEAEIDAEIRRSGCLRTDENRAVVRAELERPAGAQEVPRG
jgi:hypothetical protein